MFSSSMSSRGTPLVKGISSKGNGVIGAFSLRFCENGHSLRYPDVGGFLRFPDAGLFLGGSGGGA